MNDAELLAEMDDQDRRFFQQLCEPSELTSSFPPAILRWFAIVRKVEAPMNVVSTVFS